jgi:hypothetical protein
VDNTVIINPLIGLGVCNSRHDKHHEADNKKRVFPNQQILSLLKYSILLETRPGFEKKA